MTKTVFTNGCFDILHPGHIALLQHARSLGDRLIVAINSDQSVRAIKGPERPILSQSERELMLRALTFVDEVVVYDEPTPERIIHELRPQVLVKGGDWPVDQIVGADFVISNGGEVYSVPLTGSFSTTSIVERIKSERSSEVTTGDGSDLLTASVAEHLETFSLFEDHCAEAIRTSAVLMLNAFRQGSKVLICGNGGSAGDAQHLAAEFVGRYERERRGLPAIALTTDTSALTAIANDYSFERVFARQVEALAMSGDVLVAISTSGNSPNVLAAVMSARAIGCKVVGLTGANGRKLAGLSDVCVMIPATRTARIQEGHITVAHLWCELIDAEIEKDGLQS